MREERKAAKLQGALRLAEGRAHTVVQFTPEDGALLVLIMCQYGAEGTVALACAEAIETVFRTASPSDRPAPAGVR